MAVNRFYTPSLPEYTSQFVEDKTPWDSIIGLEQEKLQRGEKALAYAAETDALTGSLTPGYRTQNIAPEVTSAYKQKMDKWMENYGESSYSIPALRELTKINAEFRSDPNVKLIQQDREASGVYEQMRRNPNYRPESDPNIDRATGELKQLTSGASYTPYDTPINYADAREEIRQMFKDVEEERSSGTPSTVWLPGPDGTEVAAMKTTQYSNRDPEKLKLAEDALVQKMLRGETPGSQYLKAITPEDQWNENYIRSVINEEKTPFTTKNQVDDYQIMPGQTRSTKTGGSKFEGQPMTFDRPLEPMVPGFNFTSGKEDGDISKLTALGMWANDKIGNISNNENYYAAIKDDPESLLKLPTDVNVTDKDGRTIKTGPVGPLAIGNNSDMMRKAFIKNRMVEDAPGTMKMFDDYFKNKESEDLSRSEKWGLKNDKKKVTEWMNDYLEKNKIDTKAFDNDFSESRALEAALADGVGKPDSPFKTEWDLLNTPPNRYTAEQNIWLKSNLKRYEKEQSKKVGFSETKPFDPEDQAFLTEKIAGLTVDTQGRLTGSGGQTSAILGTRWIDPQNPNDEFTEKEKKKAFGDKEAFFINGWIPAETSQYGPGLLDVTIGDKQYYIEGPKEWREPMRFTTNAYSYELPNRAGHGDVFAIRDVDPNSFQLDVVDRWNNIDGKKGAGRFDTYMVTRRNPRNNQIELNVFSKNPMEIEGKDPVKEPYDPENNPDGYRTVPLGGIGDQIPESTMRFAAMRAFLEMKRLKGHDVSKEIESLQQAYTKINGTGQ